MEKAIKSMESFIDSVKEDIARIDNEMELKAAYARNLHPSNDGWHCTAQEIEYLRGKRKRQQGVIEGLRYAISITKERQEDERGK